MLLAALGFAIPVTMSGRDDTAPVGTRTEQLVAQLGQLGGDGRRLATEIAGLEDERTRLAGDGVDPAALGRARAQADALAVLAGTVPAVGPGVEMVIGDPRGNVGADVVVDALQELRDAGAEAIEIGGVRVVAESYVVDRAGGGLDLDGSTLRAPYRMLVLGDPNTLAQAMRIPGGVLDTVATRSGATATITNHNRIEIHAVRAAAVPRYARPTG
jgi:uncharacterized protein YlxW (UPF0749 family)